MRFDIFWDFVSQYSYFKSRPYPGISGELEGETRNLAKLLRMKRPG